jgi:hypothetical protein
MCKPAAKNAVFAGWSAHQTAMMCTRKSINAVLDGSFAHQAAMMCKRDGKNAAGGSVCASNANQTRMMCKGAHKQIRLTTASAGHKID